MCECACAAHVGVKKCLLQYFHRANSYKARDLSKWVTFLAASPVVNLMSSLSPHGNCCDIPVTNYHYKTITGRMEECWDVKPTEAAQA